MDPLSRPLLESFHPLAVAGVLLPANTRDDDDAYARNQLPGSIAISAYEAGSLEGPLATSAILRVILRGDGTYETGRLVPTRLVGAGVPALDRTEAAHGVVRELSRDDFGARGVNVTPDGVVTR